MVKNQKEKVLLFTKYKHWIITLKEYKILFSKIYTVEKPSKEITELEYINHLIKKYIYAK